MEMVRKIFYNKTIVKYWEMEDGYVSTVIIDQKIICRSGK